MLSFLKLDPGSELDRALATHRRSFMTIAGLSGAFNFTTLAPAIYMLNVYDRALPSRNATTLVMLTIMLLVVLVVMHAIDSARTSILMRVGVQLQESLGQRVYDAIMRRNLAAPDGSGLQPMSDLTTLRQFLGGTGPLAFFDIPWAPIFLVLIFALHPLLGVYSLAASVLTWVLAVLNDRLSRDALEQSQVEYQRASSLATGQLRNAEVAEALGMVARIRARWSAIQDRVLALQATASERAALVGSMSRFVRFASTSMILGLGAFLAIEGVTTPGAMIMGSLLMARALSPIELVISNWRMFLAAKEARTRLKDLLAEYPATPPSISLPRPSGSVTVENVTAAPPGVEKPVIHELSFSINAGDSVGVIGPSASGKSSLARLLIGVWRPSNGNVRLDSADVASWDKAELGQWLGYLPQDVEIFEGTVAENISRFGNSNSEAVIAAATLASAHNLALRLPEGYETQLSAGARGLSPGQRQRFGLARALYGDTRLVVLDEPDASLDDSGLAALLNALRELKRRKITTVVISHRPNVIQLMDKLLVLRDGRLAAYGPTNAVLESLRTPKSQPAQPAIAPPKEEPKSE